MYSMRPTLCPPVRAKSRFTFTWQGVWRTSAQSKPRLALPWTPACLFHKGFYFQMTSHALRWYTLQNLYSMDISLPHKKPLSSFTDVVCYLPLWLTLIFYEFCFLPSTMLCRHNPVHTLCPCLPDLELRLFLAPIHTLELLDCSAGPSCP